jgi:hypothetical protein
MTTTNNTLNAINEVINAKAADKALELWYATHNSDFDRFVDFLNEYNYAKAWNNEADAAKKYGYHFNYMPVPTWEGPVNPLWLNDCPCARFLMN